LHKFSFLGIAIILLLAAGCGGDNPAPGTSTAPTIDAATITTIVVAPTPIPESPTVISEATPQASSPTTAAASLPTADPATMPRPVLASSELVVGRERFVFGLIDPQTQQPISDAPQVSVQFFKVNDDGTATKVGDATPIFRSENLPAGVYVTRTNFDQPGKWGALMLINRQGLQPYQVRAEFEVSNDSTVPMVGEPAPRSNNMTVKDANIDEICSAKPHDDMHGMTIAEAVTSGKPSVILFAAPGFCPSFTCGPDLQMVQTLKSKYGDKANFIHIEAPNEIQNHSHDGPVDEHHNQEQGHQGVSKPQVKTAQDWGLKTEPWLFLVDKDGKVADRFEGGLTLDEVEPEFQKIIQ